jgi:uncharacterized membrane protein YgcG
MPGPRLRGTLAALALGAAGLGFGTSGAVADVLPPSQPGVNVYDFAGIWRQDTTNRAQAIVDRIRERTQAEIAVVSWPSGMSSVSIGGAAVDARVIMDAWGVGRAGVNDGLVVLFDMDTSKRHGQIYLATGQGFMERYLSDAEAQAVVDGDMLPKARDGDLDGALIAGLEHLDRIVQPGGNPERALLAMLRTVGAALILVLGLLVVGLFVRAWWRQGRDAAIPLIDDSVLLPSPPPGLTPALATVLRRDLVTREAFTAALVDLGHRGLVTFAQQGDKARDVDLVVPDRPLDDDASQAARSRPLGVAEHGLASLIEREAGADGVLDHAKLRSGTGKKLYEDFRKHIGIAAATSGWFRDDPNRLVGRWMGVGVGLAILAVVVFFFVAADQTSAATLVAPGAELLGVALGLCALAGIAIAVLSRYMAARTESGAQTLAMALAYRNTLRYEIAAAPTVGAAVEATQRRLPWITTPDLLTVWAVALGLNDEIDRLIRQTFEADRAAGRSGWTPAWFSGPAAWGSGGGGLGGLGSAGLAGAVASISVAATSSSGGGFGGGGGGGGGGAGGGF